MSRVISILSAVIFFNAAVFGQSKSASVFDVVSVRPAQPVEGGGLAALRETISPSHGSLTMRNVTLASIIRWAYNLRPFELSGPDWLTEKRFDIAGKAAETTSEDQLRLMLRGMLSDRFKLAVHQQAKELSSFVLTERGAPKLKAVEGSGEGSMTGAALSFEGHGMTMLRLANILSSGLKVPVIDQTGLDGHYDFKLDMRPYFTARQPGDPPLDLMGIAVIAVQEQLGLKLEARKMPIDILVVDHAERAPTEN